MAKYGQFYELNIFSNIKIYPIINHKKLRQYNNDPLPEQKQKRPKPVRIDKKTIKLSIYYNRDENTDGFNIKSNGSMKRKRRI